MTTYVCLCERFRFPECMCGERARNSTEEKRNRHKHTTPKSPAKRRTYEMCSMHRKLTTISRPFGGDGRDKKFTTTTKADALLNATLLTMATQSATEQRERKKTTIKPKINNKSVCDFALDESAQKRNVGGTKE